MVRHFHRLLKIDDKRLIKRVFLWDKQLNDWGAANNWSSEIKDILQRNGQLIHYNQSNFPKNIVIKSLKLSLFQKDLNDWKSHCLTLPKLRTFIQFKDFTSDPPHIFKPLSFMQRKSLSKFRLGLLHLRIETGRFVRPRLEPEDRVCHICGNGEVEDEKHFLLFCNRYQQLRQTLFNQIPDRHRFTTLTWFLGSQSLRQARRGRVSVPPPLCLFVFYLWL